MTQVYAEGYAATLDSWAAAWRACAHTSKGELRHGGGGDGVVVVVLEEEEEEGGGVGGRADATLQSGATSLPPFYAPCCIHSLDSGHARFPLATFCWGVTVVGGT